MSESRKSKDDELYTTIRFVVKPEILDLIWHLIYRTADVYEITRIMKLTPDDEGTPISRYFRIILPDGTIYEVHHWRRGKRYYYPKSNNIYIKKKIKPKKAREITLPKEFPDWDIDYKEVVEEMRKIMESTLKQQEEQQQ